jgi:transcriptional regulator NrdR family protein
VDELPIRQEATVTCACGGEARVKETRQRADGSMRRRRKCIVCGAVSMTIEKVVYSKTDTVDDERGTRFGVTTSKQRATIRGAIKILSRLAAQKDEAP